MRALSIFSFWAAVSCVTASAVSAQGPELRTGIRIRFSVDTSDALHVAQITRVEGDSVFVDRCPTCSRLSYNRAELNHLAVFRPYPSGMRMVSGFGIGGLVGLGVSLVGASGCKGDKCDGWLVLVPFSGIAGGLIGALAGYLTAYRWEPVGPSH